MLEYSQYVLGDNPQKLVIFLHGYNGCAADHQYAINWLCESLQNSVLSMPEAPEICDKNPDKKQWFGMLKYDADSKRSLPNTSVGDIFGIYELAAAEIDSKAQMINAFIDAMQQKFMVDDAHTFLVGFSQGAMLTIYTSLTHSKPLGGAFALSGLVAGKNLLQQKITARPPIYLFHGKEDLKVQYKTLATSEKWLQEQQVVTKTETYAGLAHKMCEAEMQKVAQIINNRA